MTHDNKSVEPSWYLHSAAGACSGAITRMLGQPFDVIKIRFQLQVEPLSKNSFISKYKSISQSIYLISKEEGFKALWKGHLPGQLLSITFGFTQFVVFQQTLDFLSKRDDEIVKSKNYEIHFVSGVIASTTATVVSYPFDVMRTRLVAQKSNQMYINMRHVFTSIYKTGVFQFYRGLFPSLILNSMQGGFIFSLYNGISNLLVTNTSINKSNSNENLNGLKQFMSGFFSGILSKTCVYPFDILKKRLQLQDFVEHRSNFGEVAHDKGNKLVYPQNELSLNYNRHFNFL
ncbi:mitochondrial thiamine pyrophosphate carrier-like isoform X2 [Daktulosphaira vitifoliae]|uniref:mitochondrial thiamine pyrophosphate carrier-like isoform X2 n=1 Tax=Daktulosphaira vitifoliae TaxID=58002 RepID=UPI0021AA5EC7|nr:mitochondrial thiamine pyrophosphate carrier-like isoform X2 [Daktulosphaira vitifoliae]